MTEPTATPAAAPPVVVAAEADAIALVTALLAGDVVALRVVVAGATAPRRLLSGFLLAERALAAAAGRARQAGVGDGGRDVLAAALTVRPDLGAAPALTSLGSAQQVAAAQDQAVQLVLALAGGAVERVRDVLRRQLGPRQLIGPATLFSACLAELTAAVVHTVSGQRGEPASAYLQRWGLELAADQASRSPGGG